MVTSKQEKGCEEKNGQFSLKGNPFEEYVQVKLDHLPRDRDENKKYLKPTPRFFLASKPLSTSHGKINFTRLSSIERSFPEESHSRFPMSPTSHSRSGSVCCFARGLGLHQLAATCFCTDGTPKTQTRNPTF